MTIRNNDRNEAMVDTMNPMFNHINSCDLLTKKLILNIIFIKCQIHPSDGFFLIPKNIVLK